MSTFISRQEPSRKGRGGYSIENLKIRWQGRPVVALTVNFQIFIPLWGSRGAGPPSRGSLRRNSETFLGTLLVTKEYRFAAADSMKDKWQLAARSTVPPSNPRSSDLPPQFRAKSRLRRLRFTRRCGGSPYTGEPVSNPISNTKTA